MKLFTERFLYPIPLKLAVLTLIIFLSSSCWAKGYRYTLSWSNPAKHTYEIKLDIAANKGQYTDFAMPRWRPGKYVLQQFAAAVSEVSAKDIAGESLKCHKVNNFTWRVYHKSSSHISLQYKVFADQVDAGSSYLGEGQAFINPVSLFMYVSGRLNEPVKLQLNNFPSGWHIATSLEDGMTENSFFTESYHELADQPILLAEEMHSMDFKLGSSKIYLHFQGNYQGNSQTDRAASSAIASICEEAANIFGGLPFEEYHFIYRLLPYDLQHAVEHLNSSVYVLPAMLTSTPESIVEGIATISAHEFWHIWNVKLIRPAALSPYNYEKEQYTRLHWFTEGVTNYYADLLLMRAGLISQNQFLQRMADAIELVENNFASSVVSPAASSFNSWLSESLYRNPMHKISYYSLGHKLGFLIDLSTRERTRGRVTFDDVFRYLFKAYGKTGNGLPENGVQKALEHLTQSSWEAFFRNYVYGTEKFRYKSLLNEFGLELIADKNQKSGAMGFGIAEWRPTRQGILLQALRARGDAYQGGLQPYDLVLAIDGKSITNINLDDYFNRLAKGTHINLRVFSDFQIREVAVRYTQSDIPLKYRIKRKPRPKENARILYQEWLQ